MTRFGLWGTPPRYKGKNYIKKLILQSNNRPDLVLLKKQYESKSWTNLEIQDLAKARETNEVDEFEHTIRGAK